VVVRLDEPAEPGRTGDVGPLAVITKPVSGADLERLQAAEPGRRLDRRQLPGGRFRTVSAIFAMCAGVVPQQPPTMLTSCDSAELADQRLVSLRRRS